MIHIVSGYMRSGTTMMMRALMAGGMTAAFDPKRDKMNAKFGDAHYQPNADGFLEIPIEEGSQPGFPKREYEGKLIKVLLGALPGLRAHDYRIVLMRRDPEEIRQSLNAFFTGRIPAENFCENYHAMFEHMVGILGQRRDVEFTVWDYREVLADPQAHLESLGWEINADAAAAVIDPERCRFRSEKLVVGI